MRLTMRQWWCWALCMTVTACSTPKPTAPPVAAPSPSTQEPRVSALGSDVSDLPELYPDADWIPLSGSLFEMSVFVDAHVNGTPVRIMLDTGAATTTLSVPVAEALGLVGDDEGRPVRGVDAHGNALLGERVRINEVVVGHQRFSGIDAMVLSDQPDLFLLGADVLRNVDVYLAADDNLVGLFRAGRSPQQDKDTAVPVVVGDRQLLALGRAQGAEGLVSFQLIVDTGAWNTSVPLLLGINGGLPADTRFASITVAVGGEQENRGRFVLDPLFLGLKQQSVGRVLAIGSTLDPKFSGPLGLLGNDVMMRHHTILSFRRGELRIKQRPERPAFRMRGPGGSVCTNSDGARVPCIEVALVKDEKGPFEPGDMPGTCLKVHVDKAFKNRTLELAITTADPDMLNGGAIRAFVTANDQGASWCSKVWQPLLHLGVHAGTPLSLRWVRTEGVQWPCDPMKTRCITFTGPLAKLATKNSG